MGVSLHYRGKLADLQQIEAICAELTDIAGAMNWTWSRLDDDLSKPATAKLSHSGAGVQITGNLALKGVSLRPHPECETMSFFFDANGTLYDPITRVMALNGELSQEQTWVGVKTQFAPPDVHVTIVKLLKYLKKRYIFDLEVLDEGGYWETGDYEALKDKIAFLAGKIKEVKEVLSSIKFKDYPKLSDEDRVSMIEEILRKKMDINDNP